MFYIIYNLTYFRLNKVIKDVNKFMQSQEKGPWPQNKISALDRVLGEAVRILDKKVCTCEYMLCQIRTGASRIPAM